MNVWFWVMLLHYMGACLLLTMYLRHRGQHSRSARATPTNAKLVPRRVIESAPGWFVVWPPYPADGGVAFRTADKTLAEAVAREFDATEPRIGEVVSKTPRASDIRFNDYDHYRDFVEEVR